ncbi:hypothetical protein N8S35_21695, partial [Enterobacter hormaechei subsp. steigerwaltii]|nr:hypothetical protein [Enterobacter hormaechei subsp. steigerwaltii]
FGFAENTDDLFVGKTLLHGDVLMWLMKTLLTSGCTNQRGAGHSVYNPVPQLYRRRHYQAGNLSWHDQKLFNELQFPGYRSVDRYW